MCDKGGGVPAEWLVLQLPMGQAAAQKRGQTWATMGRDDATRGAACARAQSGHGAGVCALSPVRAARCSSSTF